MNARRPESCLQLATLNLAAVLVIGLATDSRAQHTPDPYNIVGEYNNQYEPYMYATYPTAPGTQPNQGRFEGRSGTRNANSFQSFLNTDPEEPSDVGRPSMPRQSGPGTPYYRAYRRFDQEFGRTYRPNESADRTYYNDQEKRNDKYFQAQREPDPRKRSQLLRDYSLDNMRAARDLSSGRGTPERDREAPPRDRFTPGGASLYSDAPDTEDNRAPKPNTPTTGRPLGSAPPSSSRAPGPSLAPPPRRAAGPSTAPPASSRRETGLTPQPGGPSRSGNSASRASASGSSSRSGSGAASNAAELLNRSELLDRATRSTSPVLPRSVAPAPR